MASSAVFIPGVGLVTIPTDVAGAVSLNDMILKLEAVVVPPTGVVVFRRRIEGNA